VRGVVIAAKELSLAKTRLRPVCPADQCIALAEAMFRDVLAASLSARSADQVAVVTSDRALLAIARKAGALAIDEGYPRGLNAAVAMATAMLAERGVAILCTVLSDIPMVMGEDIDAVFAAMPAERSAVLVPSRDFSGTNLIARAPAGAIPTRFGTRSLVRHLDECRRLEVTAQVLRLARPALDLDLPEDLYEFVRLGGSTHTMGQLERLGIAHQ
jgi:2-phospho-L-lactate/phosphoenolpyruvate guanylyltransferase